MRVMDTIRNLFARGRAHPVTDLLLQQIDLAIEAVEMADRALMPKQDPESLVDPIRGVRKEVRAIGDALVDEMSAAFTVPLEREDLYRVTQYLVVVTSDARDIVKEMSLWGVKPGEWSKDALPQAVSALKELREGVGSEEYVQISRHFRDAHQHATKLRQVYQERLNLVFSQELTMSTLKRREILRRVDMVGRHLADLSATFLDALAKRYL